MGAGDMVVYKWIFGALFLSSKIYAVIGCKMLIYVGEIWRSAEMTVEITVIWNVTPYSVVDLRRNVGSYLPEYTMPHPRRRLLSN